MFCQFIPNELLKEMGDTHSIKISDRLRNRRNRFRQLLSNLFSGQAGVSSLISALKGRQRSTFDCNNETKLPGELKYTETSDLAGKDLVLDAAHNGAKIVYDFLLKHFNRNSLDNKGCPLFSCVHYDKNLENAFWDGKEMVYGDGGKLFLPLSLAICVCAHEFSHGVTQNGPNLNYFGQSGAINESFSDKLAMAIEHELLGESDPKTANWFLAHEIITQYFKDTADAKGLRSFTNEPAYRGEKNPRHMKDVPPWGIPFWVDNGGVHILSTITNVAFRLYCIEMNEPSFGKPIQIVYHAHQKLKPSSKFKDLVKAEISSARELYGESEAKAVEDAYKAVGIVK